MYRVLQLLLLTILFSFHQLQGAVMMQKIDPEALAQAEINSWKAYYDKDRLGLIKSVSKMISLQFEINDPQAWNRIFLHFGLAIYHFSNLPYDSTSEDYQKQVLPSLTEAYKELKTASGSPWDADKVAKYDLEWWIERRKTETSDPEIVGRTIARLYQTIYGDHDDAHFARAGYLRATAARYRDLCKMRWNHVSETDWKIMQNILVESYRELALGVEATATHLTNKSFRRPDGSYFCFKAL